MSDNENELPRKLALENIIFTGGAIIPVLATPIFWWMCWKSARHQKIIGLQWFSITNNLQGYSCGEILWNALIRYGIPWHNTTLQWVVTGKDSYGLECAFYVPSTQAFYADVLLRQHAEKMSFTVSTPPLHNKGIPSTRYKDKFYKPIGVDAYLKSPTTWLANLIFGGAINKKVFTHEERKEFKMKGKQKAVGNEFEAPDIESRKAPSTKRHKKSSTPRLGKTYR